MTAAPTIRPFQSVIAVMWGMTSDAIMRSPATDAST
jgi:hypothetical protein